MNYCRIVFRINLIKFNKSKKKNKIIKLNNNHNNNKCKMKKCKFMKNINNFIIKMNLLKMKMNNM